MRNSRRAAAVLMLSVVALFATACTTASGGGPGGGGSPSDCLPKGAGEIHVALVADFTAFTPVPPSVVCVTLPAGSNGVDALFARADRIGAPDPRFDASGLLCAIDGLPVAPACADNGPNGPEYWSYWIGGGSWTYATVGPALRVLSDGDVDGWRFLPGGGQVAPGTSSVFSQLVD